MIKKQDGFFISKWVGMSLKHRIIKGASGKIPIRLVKEVSVRLQLSVPGSPIIQFTPPPAFVVLQRARRSMSYLSEHGNSITASFSIWT